MKRLMLTLLLIGSTALAGNDTITNPLSQPIPVTPGNSIYVTNVLSSALEASHVLKASPGSLTSLTVTDTAAEYILIMNSATVPSNGAVTLLFPPIKVSANTTTMITFPAPLRASTGIAVSNSSTGTFTLTAGGSTCIFTAQVQ